MNVVRAWWPWPRSCEVCAARLIADAAVPTLVPVVVPSPPIDEREDLVLELLGVVLHGETDRVPDAVNAACQSAGTSTVLLTVLLVRELTRDGVAVGLERLQALAVARKAGR